MVSELAVIVVTHDSERDLARCLDSLAATPATWPWDPRLRLRLHRRDGRGSRPLPRRVPAGAERRLRPQLRPSAPTGRGGAPYVLVLNPDTRILEGSLPEVLRRCDALPATGIFSVRQVDETGVLIGSIKRFPTPLRFLAEAVRWKAVVRHGQSRLDEEAYQNVTAADWLWGAFLLLRRQLVDQLEGFDERFFLYGEEIDLCRRARAAGWGVTHIPSMTIEHRIAERPPDGREYPVVQGQLTYVRKRLGPGRRALFRGRSPPGTRRSPPIPDGRRPSARAGGSGLGRRSACGRAA